MLDILNAGGKIRFAVTDDNSSSTKYNFVINNANNFENRWKVAAGIAVGYMSRFSEGVVTVVNGDKMGALNTAGDVVIPCIYDIVSDCTGGMLRVYNGEYIEIDGGSRTANGGVGKYGFISKDGTIICDLEYDNAYSFHCGRAFVEKDNKWGCIDTNGELVIPYQYDFAYSFSEDRALVYTGTLKKDGFPDKGVYSFIDLNGNTVFSGMERGFDFSDGFLNEKSTQDLIDKLKTLCSHHEARTLEREVIVANRVKTMNHSIHYNVDGIHRAIADNKQIQFRYFDYDIHKRKRYFKKGEVYVVSPWRLIYTDDNYYLLAYEENAGKFKHFRADKMDSVQALEAERIGKEAFDELDMANYTKYTFSMFGGEPEIVTMVFQNRMMGAVMDRFGSDIVAMKEDNTHFRVSVSVAVSQQFFAWVFGLGKAVRIVAPESVKEQMKKALADIAERYE